MLTPWLIRTRLQEQLYDQWQHLKMLAGIHPFIVLNLNGFKGQINGRYIPRSERITMTQP